MQPPETLGRPDLCPDSIFLLYACACTDVTIGSWMLAFNTTPYDDRRMCETSCTASSLAVYDMPRCAGGGGRGLLAALPALQFTQASGASTSTPGSQVDSARGPCRTYGLRNGRSSNLSECAHSLPATLAQCRAVRSSGPAARAACLACLPNSGSGPQRRAASAANHFSICNCTAAGWRSGSESRSSWIALIC